MSFGWIGWNGIGTYLELSVLLFSKVYVTLIVLHTAFENLSMIAKYNIRFWYILITLENFNDTVHTQCPGSRSSSQDTLLLNCGLLLRMSKCLHQWSNNDNLNPNRPVLQIEKIYTNLPTTTQLKEEEDFTHTTPKGFRK